MRFYAVIGIAVGAFALGGTVATNLEGAPRPQLFFTGGMLAALIVFAGRNFQLLQHEIVARLPDTSVAQLIARPESLAFVPLEGTYRAQRELFIAISTPVGSSGTVTMDLPQGATATPVTRAAWLRQSEAGHWLAAVRQAGFQDLGTFSIEFAHSPKSTERITFRYEGDVGDRHLRDKVEVPVYEELVLLADG